MEYIDESKIIEYLGDSKELFEMVRNSFLENYKGYLNKLNTLTEPKELFEQIHSLKGITLNLGFQKLYDSSNDVLVELRVGSVDLNKLQKYKEVFKGSYEELEKYHR